MGKMKLSKNGEIERQKKPITYVEIIVVLILY